MPLGFYPVLEGSGKSRIAKLTGKLQDSNSFQHVIQQNYAGLAYTQKTFRVEAQIIALVVICTKLHSYTLIPLPFAQDQSQPMR